LLRNPDTALNATKNPGRECYPTWMEQQEIQKLIDHAIQKHELRVAAWSGLLGLLLMAGTWHAIWMCR